MKRIFLLGLGVLAIAVTSASAQDDASISNYFHGLGWDKFSPVTIENFRAHMQAKGITDPELIEFPASNQLPQFSGDLDRAVVYAKAYHESHPEASLSSPDKKPASTQNFSETTDTAIFDIIFGILITIVVVGLGGGFYFLPTICANIRNHSHFGAIFCINLFLGWTLLGWLAAMIWAVCEPQLKQQVA
jgi:Superinfection immunity protein